MAINKKTISVNLDLYKQNKETFNIMQGTTSTILKVSLLANGTKQTLDGSEKITAIVLYNAINSCSSTMKYDGSYVYSPTDTDYDITITDDVISIPLNINFTNSSGNNILILKITDTNEDTYSYKMVYNVDLNEAYSPTSLPDNLPSFKDLQTMINNLNADNVQNKANISTNTGDIVNLKQSSINNKSDIAQNKTDIADLKTKDIQLENKIDPIKTDVDTHNTDIPKLQADVQTNTNDIVNKADNDLSNVGNLNTAKDGALLYRKDGTVKHADIIVDDIHKIIKTPYSFQTAPSTLWLGTNLALHQNGGFVENESVATGKYYLMLDYENNRDTGSKRPIAYIRGAKQTKVEMQSIDNVSMSNVSNLIIGNVPKDHQTQKIYFKFIEPVQNFKMKIEINGHDVMDYPYNSWNDSNAKGFNLGSNLQSIDLDPFWTSLTEYNIKLHFKADNQIKMFGNGTKVYYALDLNYITREEIAYKSDITNVDIGATVVRDKLQTLQGNDRLDVSAIKNIPTEKTTTEIVKEIEALQNTDKLDYVTGIKNKPNIPNVIDKFADLTDVSRPLLANKMVVVNANADGLVYKDTPTIFEERSIALKCENSTLNLISANNWVNIIADDGKFVIEPITKANPYSKNLIGFTQTLINPSTEGNVVILGSIKTNVTAIIDKNAYIGFKYIGVAEDITIENDKAQIYTLFGNCGEFGKQDTSNKYFVVFNAFKLFIDSNSGTIDTSNLANKDLSNIDINTFKAKGVTSGLLQQDLEDVDLAKLYDKGIDAKLADKIIQDGLVTEVNRLKTDITNIQPNTLPTFTWRDRGIPTIPNDKPYKAYYIHTIVLRDSNGVIDIPSNAPNGAIFSVENNDRDDYVNLRPSADTTINGNSGLFKCGHDTLNFLVKDGTDWKLAYGGVFPNSLDSLKSTISVLFPNKLHTIAEVQAQLKDRLHTFREIQNEFSNQLHTEDEIETSMSAKGFLKGINLSDQRSNFFLEQDSISFGNGFTATQDPNNNKEVKIDYSGSGVNLEDISGNVFTPEIIKSALNDIEIHQVTNPDGSLSADLNIAPNAFKEKHNEGILAFLGNKELLNSKYPRLKLHFADTRVKGGSYVYQDLTDKSYVLQDTDPQDDPNISGGTTFIVAGYIEPDDNEENTFTQDGFIDIEFVDDKGTILQDINDEPLGVRIAYKTGDKMRKELLIGEYKAKGQVKVHLRIRALFPREEIISIGANSCVMFQSTSKEESSGLALLSFMAFTGYLLRYYTRYFGTNSLNLSQFLIFDEPEIELDNTTLDFGDNTHLDVVSRVKVSINDYKLNIKDNGLDLPIWSLYKHYNAQDTKYILGKDYKATVKLTDKNSAYDVSMLKYTGTKATAPKPNLLSYVNGNPTFNSGWSIVETMFISEDVVLGEHIATKTFVIPSDAKEIAIIMYANSTQIPQTLMLNSFEGDITPWFNKNILISNAHISEVSLYNTDRKYRFENDLPKGSSSFRYTVNSTDTKMPWGTIHSDINGVGKVVNDRSWNTGGNTWINEGDGWFKEDGEVTLTYTARLYNEQNVDNEFMFKIIKVSDGTTVTGSEYSGNIKANTNKPLKITKTVTFNVENGDKYRIIAKSDKDDGFYLKTNNISTSLLALDIDFKAITSVEKDVEKLKLDADEVSFVDNNGAEVYNKQLQYNVDTGQMKVVDR